MNRNGKIAKLPQSLIGQLNHRLQQGEPGPKILQWLNSEPATLKVLKEHFESVPISKQNLSEWRNGGYQEWRVREEFDEYAFQCCLNNEPRDRNYGIFKLGDYLASELAARYAKIFALWDGEPDKKIETQLHILRALNRDIALLQKTMERASNHKNQHELAVRKADEEEIEGMKQKIRAPLMAELHSKSLARALGNSPDAQKLADLMARMEYDLPIKDQNQAIKEELAKSNPVKPKDPVKADREKDAQKPAPQEVKSKNPKRNRARPVKPVEPVKAASPAEVLAITPVQEEQGAPLEAPPAQSSITHDAMPPVN